MDQQGGARIEKCRVFGLAFKVSGSNAVSVVDWRF